MSKLVVMLRVKDGIRFVPEWLSCFEKIADEIVVLDNGSTDGTPEALAAHPKVVDLIRTEGYNEGRDKNLLYDRVRRRQPDWCIWVDVDEVFEANLTRKHFDRLMRSKLFKRYAFRRFHFVDNDHFAGSWFRLNYSAGHDRVMWKETPEARFPDLIIDSPNVTGVKGIKLPTNFRLKHLGYISKDLVDKKAEIYRAIIPEKESIFQEMYMRGERPIRWEDRRLHPQVIGINSLLNLLLLRQWTVKAFRKAGKILFKKQPTSANAIPDSGLKTQQASR